VIKKGEIIEMAAVRVFIKNKIIFAIVILLSVVMITMIVFDDTVASANTPQTQIDRLRAEKREYERKKREIEAKIEALEFEYMAEMSKKEILDQRIVMTGLEIRNADEIINQFNALIREKEYEVFLARNREEEKLQRYRLRVRDMEENGILTYLEIIFDSTSFSDLLARVDFVGDIMRSDETAYIALQNARMETEEAIIDLEAAVLELSEEKALIELRQEEFNMQLEEAHALILEMAEGIETEVQIRRYLETEEERIQILINAEAERLRRQREEEERRLRSAEQNQQPAGQNQQPAGENQQPAEQNQQSGSSSSGNASATHNNNYPAISSNCREVLARLVRLEAGGESANGKQAVAEVVLNRMVSSRWNHANTVEEVVFDTKWGVQFTVKDSIWTERGTPSSSDYAAVDRALAGPNILSRDYMYFATRAITQNDVIWIGNHAFSK